MSVKAKNITDDGLPIFNKQAKQENVTEDGLPILKKKEGGGDTSKVAPLGSGAPPTTIVQPTTSGSDIRPVGPKDWSSVENSFKNFREKQQEYTDAKNYSQEQGASPGGFVMANANFTAQYQKEAKEKYDKSLQQKDQAIGAHKDEIYEPIKNLIETGKYKDYFDAMGNFKAADAVSYFDKITKANKAGNYTRDMMVSLLKQSGQYELDQPERKKRREEEYKKEGIDINKYGIDLLDKLTTKQKSNVGLLEKETKARAANLMDSLKPKATEFGQQYMQQVNDIKNQFQQKQISEEDANKKLKELNSKYHEQITALDKEYQNGVRQLNINAQNKYGRINSEIQGIEKSVTDEMIWQSIPEADRKKIENANNKVEREIQRGNNLIRQGLDVMSDVGELPYVGLFQKSIQSGWYSGLSSIGSYLSSKGYNNSFTRYLQGKEYEAAVNAPAEYSYKEDFLKRSITGTGTSLGASAPIMIPSIGLTLGTGGLGLPEVVGTIGAGLTSYYGEKAQNTGQVYQQILDQTGDPAKAIEGAKRYEDKQTIMMPLYFIEAAGLQNLLKGGGIKKALIGTAQELSQELPTEYWQNYTQAQEAEGYKGSFGSYIKEHPETTLDVIASTLGQSGMVSMAGKVFNQISSLIPQAKAQYYADIIGKHGIDFAMENLQHQFNTGVIDEKQFQAEQEKVMLAAKKLKDFEGLGLKGDDAKAYFTLTENANRLKKAIGETDDEGLRIGYESQLKETQGQLDELVKGKGAYAIFTLPGGGEQTKIVPLSGIEKLDKDGHLNTLIHLSDKVEVKGDDNLNKQLQERKQQLGNPNAPEGFYTQKTEITDDQNGVQQLEKSRSILETALKEGQIKGIQADLAQTVLDQAKDYPQAVHDFLKEVADQALNKVKSEVGDPSAAAEQTYGKNVVDRAKELFPIEKSKESSIGENKVSSKHNDSLNDLNERANKLGYNGIKQLNTQEQLNENASPEVKQLLQEYGDHNEKVKSLTDINDISNLDEDNFNIWKKANDVQRDDLGRVINNDELPTASKRIQALRNRGLNEEANNEIERLKNSKKNENWTQQEWRERFDEDLSQSEIDAINKENAEFNSDLDKEFKNLESAEKDKEQTEKSKGEIKTQEDFESELKKELGLEGLKEGALPKLGDINKQNNLRPANEDISQYSDPKNVLDKANEFYKDNPVISRLIKFLEPIINTNKNIRIEELKSGGKILGLSHPDGKIELNFNAIKDYDTLYRTALHEMVHAATRNEISKNQAFRDELGKVLSEVREALKLPENRTIMQLGILTGDIDENLYGGTDEFELLAEVFTNDKFHEALKNIEYKGDSLLSKIFNFIAKWFSDNYKQLSGAKENISATNIADYLMDLTGSVVKGIQGTDESGKLPSLKGESEKSNLDEKIKNVIARSGPSLTNEQIRESIKKITGLDDAKIKELIDQARAKNISSPKTKEDGKTKKAEAQTEGVRQNVAPDTGIGKEGVAGSEPVTPSQKPPTPPSEPTKTTAGSPKEEWTAVRKAKLQEIEAVKKMFEANAEKKKWVGIIESALNNLQEMYPDKNLYDAARDRVSRFATMFDNKIPFNPTSEDLAVFQYFKAETEKAINDIQGWDSANDTERIFAIAQYRGLNEDLISVAKAINPSEAGRAFGYRASEMNFDPEYGLQIRRMEMMENKGGERLTEEEKEWTANQWEKEKDLMKQEQELKEKRMNEEFDKRMADLRKEYEEKLKQKNKKPTKQEKADEKRNDYLKNKGKDWADKIRKGKLGGAQVSIPGLTPLINAAIEGVAKLVETGFTIADAIDKYVKDNNLKETEGNSIRDHFNNFIDRQIKQTESFDKIKELAKSNNVTSITTDMVSKNLIKDFVESHIGEVAPENLLEHVTNKLEEALPNLSKEKLTEAYLKTGEFRIPTKQQLQSEYEKDKAKLQRIAKLEKDINDLKSKKDIYSRSGNKSQERQVDKDIASREKELKKALQDTGLKTSNEDKFSKASYETRAQSHNDRISALSNKIDDLIGNDNLTKEQQSALTKLKGQLDASKIKLDPNSKLSQGAVVDNAENVLKKIYSDFDKSLGLRDMIPVSQVRKGLRQAIDKFNTEKEESEQNLKLQRTKDNLERGNAELQRKINAGEFNDDKVPTILKASDAELIKLQIERNKLESEIRKKNKELGDKNKNWKEKALGYLRGINVFMLIYSYATAAKVAFAAIFRPNIEAATKLTFGQVFRAAFPEIYQAAKAGGESSSWRSVKESYTALLRQMGEKKMLEIKDKTNAQYETDRDAYNAYKLVADATPNDKKVQARLGELKNNMDKSLLNAVSVFVYDYIGSSSLKDSLDALLFRANKIEQQFGYLDRESFKDGNTLDKIGWFIDFAGRSHAALKTFSARANFAGGFVARIENAIHNGVDVSNPDEILKIANESYLDWERGKYQQANYVTELWNNTTRTIEGFGKGTDWEKYSKAIAAGLKFDVAITRVPVNILHEAVMEYTLGSFRAFYQVGQAYRAAENQVALNTDLNPDTKEFKEAIKAQVLKMDPKQAATIARCYRKGGFGLGIYAFAVIGGMMVFGGFHHKGEKKKKEEDLEEGELNPGELMIGHKKVGELMSKIIEHTPAAYPALFGLNMAKIYNDNVDKGKTTPEAAMSAAIANLEAIEDGIPQTKIVSPTQQVTRIGKGALRGLDNLWAWKDVDENGNPVSRKPLNYKDHLKLLFNDRKDVLTEDNYKSAVSTLRDYNNAISDLHNQHADKEQIEELKKQRDEAIEEIYRQNKEGK